MTKKVNKKITNGRIRKNIDLKDLNIPSYDEIIREITGKIGKRPQRPSSLTKGNWTEQALRVLEERYLVKDDSGELIEDPEDMAWRVAWEVASAESRWGATRKDVIKQATKFYELMVSREFLPNSPTLMNAGTGNGLQYSACFVLPVEDSMEGIFDALKYQAMIHKTGGGTGFSFSRLRPKGARVKTSSGTASGPVSFMRIFDAATNEVKQGGKRRGANMGILRVDHPDILEFIHCKEEGGITNFNISVTITDKFMEAYEKNTDYDLVDPRDKRVVGQLNARKVFDEIADAAWRTGDPGLVFIDRRNIGTSNPVPSLGPIEATNPCGEQELYPFDACNLGSIFLTYFVREENGVKEVDWDKLRDVSRLSARFLDNVIEVNPYPLSQIRKTVFGIRRIGLGVGGWADMLVELGIPYDSDEAVKLGEEVMRVIQEEAVETSRELAKERGPFPMWPVSIYKDEVPRRNSTVTTIAPTGSISIIAGASSGIEPLFAIAFQHIVKDKHLNRTLAFFNPKFEEVAVKKGVWSETIKEKVAEHGVVRGIEELPQDIKDIFGTAHEIHHDWHIKMQAVFQKYTENAVSKTINLENKVSVDEVKDAYLTAWKTECKGITIFRDGCKNAQVLNLGVNGNKENEKDKVVGEWVRPMQISGSTYKIKTPVGTAFITVNHDPWGNPIEVFINVGKAGSDVQAMAEALGRIISKSVRFNSQLTAKERTTILIDQLKGIGGRRSVGFGPNKVLSLPDAVAMALSSHLGIKFNGFVQAENGNGIHANGHATNGNGIKTDVEIQSDLAGAVMSAQNPARQDPAMRGDDHTTATAESHLTSTDAVDQLTLADGDIIPKIADICPSCGASSLVYEEGCMKCYSCGHSEC
jgi:ribonucleoside-diphosphate reductase alpha chain